MSNMFPSLGKPNDHPAAPQAGQRLSGGLPDWRREPVGSLAARCGKGCSLYGTSPLILTVV